MEESEDQRDVELSSLFAIFPEIRQKHEHDPYTIVLDIPVNPSKSVAVLFPAATEGTGLSPAAPQAANGTVDRPATAHVDSHELSHLPSVCLEITLPSGYPAEQSPTVSVSTSPPWLPPGTGKELEATCVRLWEELGRDLVVFTYIDHVQQSAEDAFGLVDEKGFLEIDPQHKIAILDYDIQARRDAFERGTFDCGVCLEPKKGAACHRMLDCGHVFCTQCLQDFYNNAITEGDLASVRCLEPSCAKQRESAQPTSGKKRRKPKTFISPSELLQIPLEHDMVKRYVTLKYKTELETDKNTIYCPRAWCQGAARSKKHKKPEGLELQDAESDSELDSEGEAETAENSGSGAAKVRKQFQTQDLLAVCEDCGFAFCSRCYQSWHGEFFRCTPRRNKEELSAEEKASLEYVKLHTTPCPTCDCPAQKTHGCNHMICYRCNTHFCYLCSAWLDPENPYQHFNELPGGKRTSCYMRLWELEDGDGADVGYGFAGGFVDRPADVAGRAQEQPDQIQIVRVIPEIEEPDGDEEHEDVEPRDWEEHGGRVDVAREGPLVLRIAANPPPIRVVPPAVPNPPPVAGGRNRLNNPGMRQHQQHGQRGRRGGRGGGHAMPVGPGAVPHRQNQNRQANHGRNNVVVRDMPEADVRRNRNGNEQINREAGVELDAAQEAWVRNFVQLALVDGEDLIESDSDEEMEEIVFRIRD